MATTVVYAAIVEQPTAWATIVGADDFQSYGVQNPAPNPLNGTASGGLLWNYIDGGGNGALTNEHRIFNPAGAGSAFNSTSWITLEVGGGLGTSIPLSALTDLPFDNGSGGVVNGSIFNLSFVVAAETSNAANNVGFNYSISSSAGTLGFISGGSADSPQTTTFSSLNGSGIISGGSTGKSANRRMSIRFDATGLSLSDTINFSITRSPGTNNPYMIFDDFVLEGLDDIAAEPELVINRSTGNITLRNDTATGITNIVGYNILSNGGSLNQATWDRQASGSQLANDNDQWTVLTEAGVSTDLAEFVLETTGAGNGGDLAPFGGVWSFGNVWQKSYLEDITLQLIVDDGSESGVLLTSGTDFAVTYVGDPIDPADLDGNGVVNTLDWVSFKNAYGSNVSEMAEFAAYHNGDINLDGEVNQLDLVAYRNLYAAAIGGNQQLQAATVPEPAAWLFAILGFVAFIYTRRTTMCQRLSYGCLVGLTVIASSLIVDNASAQITVPIFADDFESYAIADPANFASGADNWVHNGLGTGANASRIFASANFVPSGTTKLWIANSANAVAGTGINSKNGIVLDANTDYVFSAALVTETFDPARTATGTYDLLVGESLTGATSVIGGPQSFSARGDDAVGGESTYADQMTTHAFNSGALGGSDRLFVSIAFNGTNDGAFVGIDNVSISATADIGINVNATSGQVSFYGDPRFDFDIISYSLTSAGGQLVPGNLASLQSQGIGDPAMMPNDGVGFEVLGTPSTAEIAEGHLLTHSTIGSSTNWSLGNVFNPLTAPANRDLEITFTTTSGQVLTGTVNYLSGAAVPGDYNGDGTVNLADYTVWRDNLGSNNESAFAANTGNGGGVDASDYTFWKSRFGNNAGSLNAGLVGTTAVPEPSTALLVLIGIAGVIKVVTRRHAPSQSILRLPIAACFCGIVAWAVVGSAALATITNDRLYRYGDPGSADVVSGASVSEGSPMGFVFGSSTITADEVGKGGGVGGFADLEVHGAVYTSTSSRTGTPNTFGAKFDGTDDYLFSSTSVLGGGGLGFPGNNWTFAFPQFKWGVAGGFS